MSATAQQGRLQLTTAQLAGCCDGFVNVKCRKTLRNRETELGQNRFRLMFVDIHKDGLRQKRMGVRNGGEFAVEPPPRLGAALIARQFPQTRKFRGLIAANAS